MLYLILFVFLCIVFYKMSPNVDFIKNHCVLYYTFNGERKYFYLW